MGQIFQSFQLHSNHLLLYVLVIVTVTCTESLLSHDEECLALYQFKQSILNQDHTYFTTRVFPVFDSWKINGSDCCLWDGVTCGIKNKDDDHVIGLDLSESLFRVPVNSSNVLFNLVHLQRLNLAMNDFGDSQIPYEIGRLKQLRSLNLSNSRFTGQIPNEISELILLSSLDLSQNALKLQSPSFESLVRNLTLLEEVDFSGVDMSSSVPQFLANFSSLRSIKLKDCLLQDEFPRGIFDLPELKIVNVGLNPNLSGSLPEFRNNSSLEYLSLASTGFFGVIPESISNLNHLTSLNLQGCFFSGQIPGSLANMSQLVYLALGQNELTGQVPSLASLSELSLLELSDNQLDIGCLPDWLSKLTKLTELYADNLNIKCEIPAFLGNLTKLSKISMHSNSFFGVIPSSFMNMTQIRVLELGDNQLQGSISRTISNFKRLEWFGLYNNNFSGKVYLDMFTRLNKLEALVLGANSISFVATNNYTNETLPELKLLQLSDVNHKQWGVVYKRKKKVKGG